MEFRLERLTRKWLAFIEDIFDSFWIPMRVGDFRQLYSSWIRTKRVVNNGYEVKEDWSLMELGIIIQF